MPARFVMNNMHSTDMAREAEFVKLEEADRAAWRRFDEAVSRWQLLEAEAHGNNNDIHEAKIAAHLAHEYYRRARNALTQHVLKDTSGENLGTAGE